MLATVGATLRFLGTVRLAELILGQPWLRNHQVVHDHVADCIFVGATGRQRVYLNPLPYDYEVTQSHTEIEVKHDFPPAFKERFLNLIREHASSFHNGGRLRQTLAVVQHEIRLVENYKPFIEPPRRYSDEKRHYIDTQVREMLRDGIIEPIYSEFSSTVVIAGKKELFGHKTSCCSTSSERPEFSLKTQRISSNNHRMHLIWFRPTFFSVQNSNYHFEAPVFSR